MNLNIGVGVSSYLRPTEALEVCNSLLREMAGRSDHRFITVCSADEESPVGYDQIARDFGLITGLNGGVAANKNRLLRHFSKLDCDVVFLIEDDLQINQTGWLDMYCQALQETGMGHLTWLSPDYRKPLTGILKLKDMTIGLYGHEVNGVFMVMTRECIQRVGAFDEGFGRYGAEHMDYSRRCYHAGLYPARHPHIQEADDMFSLMPTPSCIPDAEKVPLATAAMRRLMEIERERVAGRSGFYLPL